MKSRGAWVFFLMGALTMSSVGCSSGSKQTADASPPGDAPIADAGSDRVADAPASGADAGKDTHQPGDPRSRGFALASTRGAMTVLSLLDPRRFPTGSNCSWRPAIRTSWW